MQPGDDLTTVGFTPPPGLAAASARYDFLAEVGRGGMGVVYKARDRRTGDVVAIKAIHPAVASDPQLIERFTNELLLARRITHKNVCRVHDLDDYGGTLVISMEFVEGRSLRQILRDVETVSVRQGLKIARQLAAGLAEAHQQGVVHRDLKPENILIGRDGAVKIMDFGIARLIDSRLTLTPQLIGTPAYMSPEQASGRPVDSRSDIYSLGLVLYEMFCGRPAFTGDTPVAVAAKQLLEVPVAPRAIEADLPTRIDDAIRRCLDKDPNKRFQSVLDLDAALADGTVASRAASEFEQPVANARVDRWRRRDWLLAAAAIVGLGVFFPSFRATSLAPRSQVAFDRALLRRIAEEQLQRLGVTAPVTQVGGAIDPGHYVYVATTYGAPFARDIANDPVHYWSWSAVFDGGSLNVDNRGRLVSFARQAVPLDGSALSIDNARRQAAAAAEQFLGAGVASLTPERETRGQVYTFAWRRDARGAVPMRYTVDIDNRGVAALASGPALPPGYSIESFPFGEVTMNEWGMPVAIAIALFLCAFGFARRRRVAASTPWRTSLAIASFAAGVGYSVAGFRFIGPGDSVIVPLALGLLLATVVYLGSIAVELLAMNTAPGKFDTLSAMFGSSPLLQRAGLSVLRGSLVGLVLLGVDTAMLAIATTVLGGRLSMIHVGLMGGIINGSAWPIGIVLGICVLQMAGVSLLVAFVDVVAQRVRVRGWLGALGICAVLAASGIRVSMAAVQPVRLTVAMLLVDYGLLLAAFRAFDLLALGAAVGTFALWWANYPLLVMQQPIGAIGPWILFGAWAAILCGAAATAFNSTLHKAWRRVAVAFD